MAVRGAVSVVQMGGGCLCCARHSLSHGVCTRHCSMASPSPDSGSAHIQDQKGVPRATKDVNGIYWSSFSRNASARRKCRVPTDNRSESKDSKNLPS